MDLYSEFKKTFKPAELEALANLDYIPTGDIENKLVKLKDAFPASFMKHLKQMGRDKSERYIATGFCVGEELIHPDEVEKEARNDIAGDIAEKILAGKL